ncbi:MAG: alpha/beta fold hydrolase, partial [Longimicrobiales bacterium]
VQSGVVARAARLSDPGRGPHEPHAAGSVIRPPTCLRNRDRYIGLLKDDPTATPALAAVQKRISTVVSLLTAGESTEGARQFVETIAFGPGAWAELPQQVRETFVFNAPTWLDEVHDPEALEIDLTGLRRFAPPALLTIGDESAPFFPPVVNRVAAAMPKAKTRTYAGAGHVPHLSHPAEYVRVVTEFIEECARSNPRMEPTRL